MKLPLTEPQRGYTLLQKGITLSDQYPRLAHFSPIGADIAIQSFFLKNRPNIDLFSADAE
jgi:hypothetical protein